MTRLRASNPEDETRLRGLITRIAKTSIGQALLEHLHKQGADSACHTYICFDRQLPPGAYGACYNRAGISTAAITPDASDDLLVSVLMHELCHALQPSRLSSIETDSPVHYGMISMRLCEGHAFTEQFLFMRQLEEGDPAAAAAGRAFMADHRFTPAELTEIDENVAAVLASRSAEESRQPREVLFWLTQGYLKRRYDTGYAEKIKLLAAGKQQPNLSRWHDRLSTLFAQYDRSPALLPTQKGLLWGDANRNDRLLEMLASHIGISARPPISLKNPRKAATLYSF